MADVFENAHASVTGINNGSVTVRVHNTGQASQEAPAVNDFVPSGTMVDRLTTRFDEHYGGGAS